jgi:dienelactone hydrolase
MSGPKESCSMIGIFARLLLTTLPLLAASIASAEEKMTEPETVYFASADDMTEIVGYLFKPRGAGAHGAVVLLHGRAGPYSANVNEDCTLVARGTNSPCNAATLSKRHRMWGEYWSARSYLALLPDSFGPRGVGHGFGRFTHGDPERDDVNEKTVRPFDAEGALAYLRTRKDVVPQRIFLQGWSNGGSTALNVMIRQEAIGGARDGFRAALAFYPGCGRAALLESVVKTTTPIAMFLGSADEEVSPTICQRVAERALAAGTKLDLTLYPGATHDFDDPGEKRQSVPANAAAKEDAMRKAIEWVEQMRD